MWLNEYKVFKYINAYIISIQTSEWIEIDWIKTWRLRLAIGDRNPPTARAQPIHT